MLFRSPIVDRFIQYLELELGRSANTAKAYRKDLEDLVNFVVDRGCNEIGDVGIMELRGWLADQRNHGLTSATIGRRATAARTFFAWATHNQHLTEDPAAALVIPKVSKKLPNVLHQNQATQIMQRAATRADDNSPEHIRDLAILELMYATGIRVGELVGLDLHDVDQNRRTLRVTGKGSKQRVVPFGSKADQTLTTYLKSARKSLANERSEEHTSELQSH